MACRGSSSTGPRDKQDHSQWPDCRVDHVDFQACLDADCRNTSSALAGGGDTSLHGPVTQNMKLLLHEFKGLYEQKLRRLELESRDGNPEDILRMKVRILHSYVNDLSDQNEVLVQTVEDLEKEANQKVYLMEAKKLQADQFLNVVNYKKECLEGATECLRSENLDMKIDIASLVGALQQARILQKLDFSSLILRTVPKEHYLGATGNSINIPKPEDIMRAHVDDLKSHLKAKDRIIQSLEEEMKKSFLKKEQSIDKASERDDAFSVLQSKLQTLHQLQLEKVAQIADKDIAMTKLQTELQLARQDVADMQNELSSQKEKVNELHAEIGHLQEEMAAKDVRNGILIKSNKNLEEKTAMLTVELQKREDEIHRRQKEILSLQQKKDGLLAEFQSQEYRISQIQKKQLDKDDEVAQLAAQKQQLQTELETSRNLYKKATCQLEDLKMTVQQQGQSSRDNQNVLTAEAAHWHDAFVALKSDFIQLEKKHLEALAQISYKEEATKNLSAEIMKATAKLDDTKHELEGVQAELVEAKRERDATQIESQARLATVKDSLSEEYGMKLQDQEQKVRQISEDLASWKDKYISAKEKISKLEKNVDGQTNELKQLQFKNQEAAETNGRLRARLEAQTVAAQSEQDVLSNEISCTEDMIHKLRMQQFGYEDKMAQAEEKVHIAWMQ
ncbi:myosin heavy chain, clone 203 [Amia ocellicauda]|uniref:myosin heavy chain, clone 203 n=1 Tax=Amia ocellicauda TaxID=2972642 RepID=UPI003464A29E